MPIQPILRAAACALLLALAPVAAPVLAQSDDAAFGARVRDYLLANPEVILEAMEILSAREAEIAMTARIAPHAPVFAEETGLGIGDPAAPVKIIEFFDYRCAPCKALHPRLVQAMADHPELRVDMRHLPILSPGSERGARFALAVRALHDAETYARVHDRIWEIRGPLNADGFRRIAEAERLDWPPLEQAMYSEAVTERIDANREMAIALDILGTPAFVTPRSVSFGQTDAGALVAAWLSEHLSR